MNRIIIIRLLLNVIGIVAVALGLIGIFLPLLPTTPFLLLAFACFMRGSPRMAKWMLNNRIFGSYLQDFYSNRGVTVKTKVYAISVLWVSLTVSAWFMPLPWARFLLLIPGVGVTIYLWRYKTRPAS